MGRRTYEAVALRVPPDVPLALMDIAIGLIYLIGPSPRTSAASFYAAKVLLPIRVWGVIFVLVGALVWLTTRRPHRCMTTAVRVLGPTLYVMWALTFLLSALTLHTAAMSGVPSYLYLAYRHGIVPATRRSE